MSGAAEKGKQNSIFLLNIVGRHCECVHNSALTRRLCFCRLFSESNRVTQRHPKSKWVTTKIRINAEKYAGLINIYRVEEYQEK
jgi:hypothetical protein